MSDLPSLPCFNQPEFSPMTEISINLSSTKISRMQQARKRRLSLVDSMESSFDITGFEFQKECSYRKCLQDITNLSPSRNDGEISLYGGATPETRSPESSPEIRSKKHRLKSEYFDRTSSLDSGIGSSFQTRVDLDTSEFVQLDVDESDTPELPINFNNLVSGNILLSSGTPTRDYKTPPHSRVRNRLFVSSPQTTPLNHNKENEVDEVPSERTQEQTFKLLKRSKSLFDDQQHKRYKFAEPGCSTPKPILRRSISTCSPNTIMTAVQRSAVEPDLIGDFSKPFILPLVSGRHQDLKSITVSTLANLLRGNFDSSVYSYKVIDCRYPYEFNGGHIRGALNYYTKEQIEKNLFNLKKDTPFKPDQRDIVIFHCEFSAQRGPKMFRFLRTLDRNHNNDVYPALHYPEIYLLEGGYKRFFEAYSDLCEPVAYKRMDDPEHEDECRQFRAQKRNCNSSVQNSRKLVTKRSALEF